MSNIVFLPGSAADVQSSVLQQGCIHQQKLSTIIVKVHFYYKNNTYISVNSQRKVTPNCEKRKKKKEMK